MNNPFTLFDLPVDYQIDETLLKSRYLQLQKQLHPDNFAQSSSQEQRLAIQKSAQVNDAWQQLTDPVLRAECIIALNAGDSLIASETNHDLEFLMQQMQWREELAEIEEKQDLDLLDALTKQVNEVKQDVLTGLVSSLDEKNWTQAKQQTDRLRFIQKLFVEIERVDDKLSDF